MRKIAEELSVRLWVLIHADRVAMSVEESESGELRYRSGEKLSILNTKITMGEFNSTAEGWN